jgi:5-methylcytosine-specific restriction endonuclease McrA
MVDLMMLDNLALACHRCNLRKGPNLTGIDPMSGEMVVRRQKSIWT